MPAELRLWAVDRNVLLACVGPFRSVQELSLEEDAEEATSQGTKVKCKAIYIVPVVAGLQDVRNLYTSLKPCRSTLNLLEEGRILPKHQKMFQ